MFFNEHNVQFQVISVFNVQSKKRLVKETGNGVGCPHYAISFRRRSNTIIEYGCQIIKASDNSILYVPPDIPYIKNALETEDIIVVHFNAIGEIYKEIYSFQPENALMYEQFFTEMWHTYDARSPGYMLKLNELLYRTMYLILNDEIKSGSPGVTIAEKMANLIEQEIGNPVFSTDSIADIFDLSNTRLRVLFKNKYGVSPKEYQIIRRMELAQTLLKANCFSIKEIANRCGYENEKYFSTAFKKLYGISPSAFKQL